MNRTALVRALGVLAAVIGAVVALTVATAGATTTTINGVTCDTGQYNPTHFAIQIGQTVHCTISDPNLVVNGPVNVNIQSSSFGNQTVVGTGDTSTHTSFSPGCGGSSSLCSGPSATKTACLRASPRASARSRSSSSTG